MKLTPGEVFLNLLRDQLGLASIENSDMGRTLKEIGADSLDGVEVMILLEEALDIEITDDDAARIIGADGSNTVFQAKNEVDALVVRLDGGRR